MYMSRLLHVRRNGKGPTIVLLHGAAGSGAFWEPIVPILSQKFEVVRLDLLGYGYSPKPIINYSVQEHVSSIRNTLAHEGISEPFAVIGLSMGALLWLNYSIQYPGVSKFVGIGLPYYSDKSKNLITQDRWARSVINHRVLGEAWMGVLWGLGRHSKAIRRRVAPSFYSDTMTKESLMNPPHALRSSIVNCMLNNFAPELLRQSNYKDILLIHGSNDQWSPVEAIQPLVAKYSNVSVQVLNGVAHNTALIAPERTADCIMDFLTTESKPTKTHNMAAK
jgi:pimeloyl-ACP methyl ester carboxylesterase